MIPATRNIGAGAITLSTTDNILNIDTTGGAAIITLPSVASWFELKNKSGATYDPDGLRWTDVGGAAATNNITFLAAAADLINGAGSIVVNTNGASGVITPTLDANGSGINGWEFSLVGTASAAGEYDVFGTVLIDNIFVPSLDLVGLKKIYAPNDGDNQGSAINIGGTGTIVSTVNMPDLTEVYGNATISNSSLTSFSAPSLTLLTDIFTFSSLPSCSLINLSGLINGGDGAVVYIAVGLITSVSLPEMISGGVYLIANPLVESVSLPKLVLGTTVAVDGSPALVSISAPLLSSAISDTEGLDGGGAGASDCPLLTAISYPSLLISGSIIIRSNAILTTINVPLLESVSFIDGTLNIEFNPSILSVSLPALTYTANLFDIQNNDALQTISLGGATLEFFNIQFDGNALTQAGVDDILNQLDIKGLTNNVISFDTPTGAFQEGETITGSISLATGVILWDNGSSQLRIRVTSGAFQLAETITGGTSGATGNTIQIDFPSLNLTGGTNATPSAAGLVSKASLVAKGWGISNN